MIAYFPVPYEDELLYSVFARYAAHVSLPFFADISRQLFADTNFRPDVYYMNKLTEDVYKMLDSGDGIENIIDNHTMLPYHSVFLGSEVKNKAKKMILNMENGVADVLYIEHKKNEECFLRYCPLCVKEDREKYEETYWHRSHQIPKISICPKHGCKLINSSVSTSKRRNRNLSPAEVYVDDMTVVGGSEREFEFATYYIRLVESYKLIKWDITSFGELARNKMQGTKYISARGFRPSGKKLFNDYTQFYGDAAAITKEWQIKELLYGYRKNSVEYLQFSFFLGITVEELLSKELPNEDTRKKFDDEVVKMIRSGMSCVAIANKMGVSDGTINRVAEANNIKSIHEVPWFNNRDRDERIPEEREKWLEAIEKFPGKTMRDFSKIPEYRNTFIWLRKHDREWTDKHYPRKTKIDNKIQQLEEMDSMYLPRVRKILQELKEQDAVFPVKITAMAVNKKLNIAGHIFYKLPRCISEINKYQESKEQYLLRKCLWAAKKMIEDDISVSACNFERLAHTKLPVVYKMYDLICEQEKTEEIQMIMYLLERRKTNV